MATQLALIESTVTTAAARVQHRITVLTLQSITARIRSLTGQLAHIDPELARLVQEHPSGPALLAEPDVGPVVAAQLLISWSQPGGSEAKPKQPPAPHLSRGSADYTLNSEEPKTITFSGGIF